MLRKATLLALAATAAVAQTDLSSAAIATPANMNASERKAVQMLVEEVAARTQGLRLGTGQSGSTVITIARGAGPADGYSIRTDARGVTVTGNDARGILFGVGRLLQELEYASRRVVLPSALNLQTAPKYRLRGHQLGYRPKTNSYDGWTVSMWEQYIRDLAVFGTNAIELIPPRSDDDDDSPHFPLPPMQMMIEMSRIIDEYGLESWIWYPALDKDYSDAKTVEFALKEWGEVFRQLPRIDAVFVPGGDPGHTHPKHLMPLLEKQAAQLRKYHPKAQMWVAPQGFSSEWMEEFFTILKREPAWLTGIVFGPQIRISLPELRALTPKKYPIRFYPDITHSLRSQYPVPDWDPAYALTLQREPINPRPLDQAQIFKVLQPSADYGYLTYSEGCNDDVNKIVWSGLGWDPETPVIDILRRYSRYFIGSDMAEGFAQGLLALERNWRGPLAQNQGVFTTLEQFRVMEAKATPQQLANWRFQQALYRAYYDAYVRTRLIAERGQEERAMSMLRNAKRLGAIAAANRAEEELEMRPVGAELRARVFELAEALFQSVRMQLSVPRYKAIAVGRGANLDLIDTPLSDAPWLRGKLAEVRAAADEGERLQKIAAILNWTNPGPGGFYDDLGNRFNQPHLVRGAEFADDPALLKGAMTGFGGARGVDMRMSWWTDAGTLNDEPLRMYYRDLDPKAQYRIRVIYGGDMTAVPIRLMANDTVEVHPPTPKNVRYEAVEHDIPREATAKGELRLSWSKPSGLGGNGRGVQIAEVWLIRK